MKLYRHEEAYRGAAGLAKLASARVVLCGAGAIGSNLADQLARQGCSNLAAIDHDRVEEHNIGTQRYARHDIGSLKAQALQAAVFAATGAELEAVDKHLTEKNARKLLRAADLVVESFDNARSRRLVQDTCRALPKQCLHVGLFEGYAEVVWDDRYRIPKDPLRAGTGTAVDVCDLPLARNLIMLAVTVAAEAVVSYLLFGRHRSFTITLDDLRISES